MAWLISLAVRPVVSELLEAALRAAIVAMVCG